MTIRHVTVSHDILEVGFHSVQIPHPANGYRNVSINVDVLLIPVTRDELKALKARLNEMNLE